ncbi:peroxiredoxin family protein [Aquirufa ecclesiirivi]|uniref:peroxiredoxin family protein n=1 Tax=Aquirufa ecclesiirivi TaxID=2715124 RepID=UPI0022A80FAA|nr:TlpA disulfide reductase family protein [Aquirufa ecclesiirivi]MCZ2471887.1 AhpC/TSA family protein [Aquirufa ecclesiirivi]MDF0693600.1 TlpA disulfide reductase family protein [Aquirufa ecclesiirivi]
MNRIYLLAFIFLSFALQAQEFTIQVKVKQIVPQRKIYLEFLNARGQAIKIDSLSPDQNNSAVFRGKVLENGGFYLINFYDIANPQKVLVILEGNESILVEADGVNLPDKPGTYSVTGESINIKMMNQVMAISKGLEKKVIAWNAEIQKTPASQTRIQKEFETAQNAALSQIKALIPQMGANLVVLWTTNFLPAETEMATLEIIADKLRAARPNHVQIKPFLENLKRLKGISIGSEAPEISLPSPNGEKITLSSLRGKYVLIDFWASWCGPCRRENPNVIKTYARFKDKGFEIFGVSLDQDKSAWLKAIDTDQLTWKHVSDLQYWNSVAAQAYQVSAIPMTFMLDKEGKIMAKGLRGASLDQFLENLFKGK